MNESRMNERWATWLNHILALLMIACVAVVLTRAAERLAPGWVGGGLPAICLLIALEGVISWRIVRRLPTASPEYFAFRGSEWLLILVVLRVYSMIKLGESWRESLESSQNDLLQTILTPDLVLSTIIALIIWLIVTRFAEDLAQFEGDEQLLKLDSLEGVESDRAAVRGGIFGRFIGLGIVIILLFIMGRIDLPQFVTGRQESESSFLPVLLYFLLGLILLSQSQLAVLRASWNFGRFRTPRNMTQRWFLISLTFLVVVVLIALFLPAGFAYDFMPVLDFLGNWLYRIIAFLVFLAAYLFLYLITQIGRLLGISESAEPTPNPRMEEILPIVEAAASENPWLATIRVIIFWTVLAGLVGLAFYYYLKQNQDLLEAVKALQIINWLGEAWKWLQSQFQKSITLTPGWIRSQFERLSITRRKATQVMDRRWIHLRRLNARQQVLFYYLALVRRGGERGLPRQPAQTPQQYASDLKAGLAQAEEAVDTMTGSFIEARYSQHEISSVMAKTVRRSWANMRRVLRQSYQKEDSDG